jgi:probable F420-dependent oxidoreductase
MSTRPFRFTTMFGQPTDHGQLIERARRAESLGYDVVVIADHLLNQLSPLPTLVAVAEATTRLRIGTYVLNNDLRHPAVLAQDLATVDLLSGGRLEIGIGAGWNQVEYERAGIPFDPIGTRVTRMEESIRVLKGLFADGPFSFEGQHYRIAEMDGLPKPHQRPHPPFLVGGGGRRVLGIGAREAQIVGLAPRLKSASEPDILGCMAAGTLEKIGWVRSAADGRFGDIEFSTYNPLAPLTITGDRRAAAREACDQIRSRYGVEVTGDDLLDSPHAFIGTVDELVEKCLGLRERFGITNINVRGAMDEFAPVVERLAGS